ncbi:hypothetical protein CAPTEDRAFT_121702 [Capitella teleta]|uniref:Recombination-associated protein RdgC n=1 Tax=Capitella teleta TaxID=283909 RepID=R7VCJ4_CAPTE|nr:hypothetical protein CAPTEDRAFT_121702 [Capitella teleta]|eukprot:ELU16558.1 hypothetical protein CAPTEDRAFT_121702 [Capitella teleta]
MKSLHFKNLTIYTFTKPWATTVDDLETRLNEKLFRSCESQDFCTYGFVPALGGSTSTLVHSVNGCLFIAAKKQTKLMPNYVINSALNQKIAQIEQEQDRQVSSKEKKALKDDVIMELLPQAFTQDKDTIAYIDTINQLLIINASSHNESEELTSLLRYVLGSLPIVPIIGETLPRHQFTEWVKDNEPEGKFTLGYNCRLIEPVPDGAEVTAKREELICDGISTYLEDGMVITELGFGWDDRLTGEIKEDLRITKLKFTDEVIQQLDNVEAETREQQMDADLYLLTSELRAFTTDLMAVFNKQSEAA